MGSGRKHRGRSLSARDWASDPDPIRFEQLERRILLSANCPVVTDYLADNRGLVILTVDRDLNATTVNRSTVEIFTAGNDNLLGTADDDRENITVSYDEDTHQITALADLEADTRFMVKLDGSIIEGTNGVKLDGEFNGVNIPSGNGTPGGDLVFFARSSSQKIARFDTVLGVILVDLFNDTTPETVQNFLNYSNDGDWDNTVFHRVISDFVIQGGGFMNVEPDFDQVPTDPPVINEPGISNLRGTIAMAKIGNQPNSATSQWFFNLGDNSANLDFQNGGFTVFGEIIDAAGLSVMDAIAALDTVNITDVQPGTFSDIPVLDKDRVDDDGLTADNTASVSRLSILMDIKADAFGQLDPTGSHFVESRSGLITVRLYDLSGAGLPDGDYLKVEFNGRRKISKITLRDPFPMTDVGLQISGAESIGQIVDKRTGSSGRLQFVVTSASISSIRLQSAITGMNLNGFVLEGGLVLPEDVDGDGATDDPLAIFVGEGLVRSITVRNEVTGSIVAPGGLDKVRITGTASETDFVIGAPVQGNARPALRLDRVENSQISSDIEIKSITAADWQRAGGPQKSISAPSIGSLRITGDKKRGIDGVFEAGVVVSGNPDASLSLGSAHVEDAVIKSEWLITGSAGNITIGAELSQSRIVIGDALRSFKAGSILAADVLMGGHMNSLTTAEWTSGDLRFASANRVKITGDRSANIDGIFGASMTVTGVGEPKFALKNFDVAGDVDIVNIDITGDTKTFRVRGDILSSNIDVEGDISRFQASFVRDTDILFEGRTNRMTFDSWQGGDIRLRRVERLDTGNRARGISGDIIVGAFEAQNVVRMTVGNGGDLQGRFRLASVVSLHVTGDIFQSAMVFATDLGTQSVLNSLRVDGMMDQSSLYTLSSVQDISLGGMNYSGIYVGATEEAFGLVDDPQAQPLTYRTDRSVDSFTIRGMGAGEHSMIGSYFYTGHLKNGSIMMPKVNNFGQQFGVAVGSINSFVTKFEDGRQRLGRNASTPPAVRDYQVRIAYEIPDNA